MAARPRSADDFAAIRARMEELRRENRLGAALVETAVRGKCTIMNFRRR
jgi:hypothetical protein